MDDRDATPGAHPCPDVVSATRSRSRRPPNLHRWIEAKSLVSRLGAVDGDGKLQEMQMYGAEDAEDLVMILDHLDKKA